MCIKLRLTIVQIFQRKRVLFLNLTTDLCGASHFDYIIHPIHRSLSVKLIIKLKLVTEVLEVMWQSDSLTKNACCLKVSQTSEHETVA